MVRFFLVWGSPSGRAEQGCHCSVYRRRRKRTAPCDRLQEEEDKDWQEGCKRDGAWLGMLATGLETEHHRSHDSERGADSEATRLVTTRVPVEAADEMQDLLSH